MLLPALAAAFLSLGINADGRPASGQLGDVVARYAYDGLGRLIRKQSAVNKGASYVQSKDFYYDGVRLPLMG